MAKFFNPAKSALRSIKPRTQIAPIKASVELLTNQDKFISSGTPLWICTSKWNGNTPRMIADQSFIGVSKSAVKRMAFGGQRVETALEGKVRANPINEPTYYAP